MTSPNFDELPRALKTRFDQHPQRQPGVVWSGVQHRLRGRPAALQSLQALESTGAEPDMVGVDAASGGIAFCDCAPESPAGRRSLCCDRAALDACKHNKPGGNAIEMAAGMGAALLTEDQYRHLQTLGTFDQNTSSWLATPRDVRQLGGALFGDRRYGRVFVYHNGADSYYAVRGFRAWVVV